jgi:molecular chaperone HtpG
MTATQEAPQVNQETFEFQAETKELLSLMIHSIYSNKEIFLRELISNASDAMDKLKFEALTNPDLAVPSQENLTIFLEPNPTERTLTIHDKGIGMSREDLVKLIGTIAKSGTREFIENLKEQKDQNKLVSPELIGQFGVGFYSSFIVSDKVRVVSRKAGETTATQWESTGDGKFTISDAERSEAGTSITLFLKPTDEEDGMQDYTQEWTLKSIVKKYSDFVSYPIQMDVERTEIERDAEGKPVENGKSTTTIERITLNSMKAIWTRPQAEVTDEEYNEFYKHISHDWQPPLKTIRFKFEGNFEAQALLFLPSKAPFDLFYQNTQRGIQLYVKRVFIMDDCKELMPNYLRFVKGVVDSEDLSLNISREILQQNRQIQAIRSRLIKKVLSTLDDLKVNDLKTYEQFWGEFGKALKEGLFEDHSNQQALLDLCLFQSTNHDGELTSLKGYLSRMKPDQDNIYYMTGEKRSVMEQSPHLEAFKAKGIEVLFLTDPVDEIWVQQVFEFEGYSLKSVGKGMVELGSEEEKKQAAEAREEKQKSYASLLETIQKNLDEEVKEVRISTRLTSSAACLVGNENDITPQMEQLLKAMNQEVPKTKRILELNPEHPVLQQLQKRFEQNKEDALIGEFSQLLLGQALLAEGSALPNPGAFSQLVAKLMVNQLS